MSVTYRVRHTTRFDYPIPVSVCHNLLCLTPRATDVMSLEESAIAIDPVPTVVTDRIDSFGNTIHAFSIEEPHGALVIDARSRVVVTPVHLDISTGPAWESIAATIAGQTDPSWFEVCPFVYDSILVERTSDAYELAQEAFTPNRPIDDAALALTELIHDRFEYLTGSTHVGTTSTHALAERRGVCQDFSHVMIAALRSIGLPARYISGYLRTMPPPGKPRLVGADQSHAWAGVYAGEQMGWIDMDPTNRMPAGLDHIPLAIGRDYTDVAPIRGAFLGGGDSVLSVSVDVAPVDQ